MYCVNILNVFVFCVWSFRLLGGYGFFRREDPLAAARRKRYLSVDKSLVTKLLRAVQKFFFLRERFKFVWKPAKGLVRLKVRIRLFFSFIPLFLLLRKTNLPYHGYCCL